MILDTSCWLDLIDPRSSFILLFVRLSRKSPGTGISVVILENLQSSPVKTRNHHCPSPALILGRTS